MTEMMELMNKGIKAAIINMLYMFRQVEEMVNIGERNWRNRTYRDGSGMKNALMGLTAG